MTNEEEALMTALNAKDSAGRAVLDLHPQAYAIALERFDALPESLQAKLIANPLALARWARRVVILYPSDPYWGEIA